MGWNPFKSIGGAINDAWDTVKGAAHDAVHKAKEVGEDFVESPGLAIGSSLLGYYLGGTTGAMVGAQIGGSVTQGIEQKKQAAEDRRLQEETYAKQEEAARKATMMAEQQRISAGMDAVGSVSSEAVSDYNDATRRRRRFKTSDTVNSANLLGGLTGRSVLGG